MLKDQLEQHLINLNDGINRLEKSKKMQRSLPELAKKEGKPYEPGIFKIATGGSAEANEQTFAKVIYQDEKGNKFEIPIQGITPELTYPNPDAK